ncbi:hypothetical protein Trydic_g12945 [Trypoxylus dichotomus]
MHEVLTEGGEFTFISKMIDESSEFQDRIRVYTSMVGIKRHIKPLLEKLQKMPCVKATVTTKFHQGNTIRFGIAWTFDDSTNLNSFSCNIEQKTTNKPYLYSIKPCHEGIENVDKQFIKIFDDLQLTYYATKEDMKNVVLYEVEAYGNTWSHSRRKRRELARKTNPKTEILDIAYHDTTIKSSSLVLELESKEISSSVCGGSSKKRKSDSSPEDLKRAKIEERDVFLKCGLGGKDACHQILQYLKNHLKFSTS